MAKRAVSRLGDMVGEEVMLTVEDFREKGAIGAVKDAVADAGDILIDGVSGMIGWIRGEPPPEEESEKTEDATRALSNGPAGAAYGISQASPTGGINAVWVMPDEADPNALATLAQQQGGLVPQQSDPRVPKNIQPYQPPPGKSQPGNLPLPAPMAPMSLPGGPMIAPYQPAPSGPGVRPPPFVPGPAPSLQQGRWGPGGYNPSSSLGGVGAGAGAGSATSGAPTGAKGLVERIAKGEVLVGPDVAKRLVSQCTATKTTPKQLGEIICERTRRLYLGLDGGDPADADAALARLLGLVDALAQQGAEVTKGAIEEIKKGVTEELLSLRSSAKHKDEAEPMLRRLGLIDQAPAAQNVDLLGGAAAGGSAQEADLLGASVPAKEADLLGSASSAAPPAAAAAADLLGGGGSATSPAFAAAATNGVAGLDPLLAAPSAPATGVSELAGLNLDSSFSVPASTGSPNKASSTGAPGTMGAGATMASQRKELKKDEDAFGFVSAEMSKASGKP